MTNLVVAGGGGFLGSHFVRAVLAGRLPELPGARITVLDNLAYAGSFANLGPVAHDKRLDFVPGDVTDAALVDVALRGHDLVVNLVPDVLGTQVLLDAAVRHGATRFVQISSAAVYGSLADDAWTETAPLSPTSPRAAARAAADLLTLAAHRTHGLGAVVLRRCSIYGPGQHPSRTLPRAVTDLLDGHPVRLPGDGRQVRDWLHVEDWTRAVAGIAAAGRPGEVYHVGGSIELAERDLAALVAAELGVPGARIEQSPAAGRGWDERRALDDQKLRRELGWHPQVEFDTGLIRTLAWYRAHPDRWRPLQLY